KLFTEDGAHILIRPLAYCAESDIARYARGMAFPIIPCNLCGSQDNLQRQKVKEMMADWDKRFPGRTAAVLTAMQNVVPSHLADRALFDFATLQTGAPDSDGDTVFDPPSFDLLGSIPITATAD
ncbi:MAG TPA: tRNA 2-thiocytidine(32) synthetase TtcA, partial [Rhodocyclaceae bacterium]|nr:tRNA 2-thiocytidine(32) synthetase TtcA [Rhodocyclaceae bacterium]